MHTHTHLAMHGEVVVEDNVNVGDVETTAGNIGGHEDARLLTLELGQRAQALGLRHLAMKADGGKAKIAQQQRHALGRCTSAAEDHKAVPIELAEDVGKVAILVFFGDKDVLLAEALGGGVLARHLHLNGIAQRGALELGHLVCHGGREEQRTALLGDALEQLVNFLLKVHVQNTIRLVHDEKAQAAKVETLGVLEVVDDAARRRNDDMRLLGKRKALRHHVDTANHDSRFEADAGAEARKSVLDLERKLAGWGKYKRKAALVAFRVEKRLQHRQRKRRRLAGARLSKADDITALQSWWNRFALDRCGLGELEERAGLNKRLVQSQIGKCTRLVNVRHGECCCWFLQAGKSCGGGFLVDRRFRGPRSDPLPVAAGSGSRCWPSRLGNSATSISCNDRASGI
eukprot:m.126703 g.126703  ORF g.126703 m.126703 type:complete len:401 (+) comp9711_c0_seq5:83-1285(+)